MSLAANASFAVFVYFACVSSSVFFDFAINATFAALSFLLPLVGGLCLFFVDRDLTGCVLLRGRQVCSKLVVAIRHRGQLGT